jgi:hypothetical protein
MDFVHAQGGKEIANNALGRSPPFFLNVILFSRSI